MRHLLWSCLVVLGCSAPTPAPPDAGTDAGIDAGVLTDDAGAPDAGGTDAGMPDGGLVVDAGTPGLDGGLAAALSAVPNLIICQPGATPFVAKTEMGPDVTNYAACTTVCPRWQDCTTETMVRGAAQLDLSFVVDEDGQGNGMGGTLRFTRDGNRQKVVLFHRGGSGTEWVEDFLPGKVEQAGGTYVQPKWNQGGPGWFSRPTLTSRLERSLAGVSQRPAAVMKWVALNLAQTPFSTFGCSGGSIATYYPRHWHGLDVALKYQLLMGGPVMSRIEVSCRGQGAFLGRCTAAPDTECQRDADCSSGKCTPSEWSGGLVMTAVRGTIDHLHARETNGSNDCLLKRPQPAFAISDFDNGRRPIDFANEHRIDFVMNAGGMTASDDGLNVVASGAAVYSRLQGPKSWLALPMGDHCDAMHTEAAWDLLRVGAGL